VGLLFQPRWSEARPRHAGSPASGDVEFNRGLVFLDALEDQGGAATWLVAQGLPEATLERLRDRLVAPPG